MNHPDRLVRRLLFLLLLATVSLTACGKEGPPLPQSQRSLFGWAETEATVSNDCLILSGQLTGAYENATLFVLELETVTEEICLDCPFKPSERPELTPVSEAEGLVTFQYCPTNPAPAYRWRLVGHNVFPALPHALSPIKLTRKSF